MIRRIFRICNVVDQFRRKSFWFFLRIFFYFGLDKIEKQGIKDFSICKSKSYTPLVLRDSEVIFLRGVKGATLSSKHAAFLILIFFPCCVKMFLWKLSKSDVAFTINNFFR